MDSDCPSAYEVQKDFQDNIFVHILTKLLEISEIRISQRLTSRATDLEIDLPNWMFQLMSASSMMNAFHFILSDISKDVPIIGIGFWYNLSEVKVLISIKAQIFQANSLTMTLGEIPFSSFNTEVESGPIKDQSIIDRLNSHSLDMDKEYISKFRFYTSEPLFRMIDRSKIKEVRCPYKANCFKVKSLFFNPIPVECSYSDYHGFSLDILIELNNTLNRINAEAALVEERIKLLDEATLKVSESENKARLEAEAKVKSDAWWNGPDYEPHVFQHIYPKEETVPRSKIIALRKKAENKKIKLTDEERLIISYDKFREQDAEDDLLEASTMPKDVDFDDRGYSVQYSRDRVLGQRAKKVVPLGPVIHRYKNDKEFRALVVRKWFNN